MCPFLHKILFYKVVIKMKNHENTLEIQGKKKNKTTPSLVEAMRFSMYPIIAQKGNAIRVPETLI